VLLYSKYTGEVLLYSKYTWALTFFLKISADLHVLNTAQMQWSGVIDLKKFSPEPRVGHSVCMWGSEMFVFGGGDSQTVFGDLCILDSEVLTREVQSAVVCMCVYTHTHTHTHTHARTHLYTQICI
jgi:hypothetical protein